MARPKKIIFDKLRHTVSTKLNDSDYEKFLKNVSDSKLKRSQYVRECVLGDTTIINPPNEECESLEQYRVYLLSTMSNNLNQLTKAVNKAVKKTDINKAISILEQLKEIREDSFNL